MKSKLVQAITFLIALFFLILFIIEKRSIQSLNEEYELLKYEEMVGDFVGRKLANNLIRSKDFYLKNVDVVNTKVLDESGASMTLKDLSIKNQTLFFRYSELGCNTCTEKVIKLINTYEVDMKYLATYQSKTYLNTFKRMNRITQEVFNVPLGEKLFPLDTLGVPYFFVVDSLGNIVDAHIPVKENLYFTEEFLVARKLK